MKRYTKEYVEKLLNKFMNGTSTLEEEDILEIDAMRPVQAEIVEINPENRRKRWMGWGVAAAVVAGILYFAVSSKPIEPTAPLTAKVDTTATVVQPEIPISETKTDTVSPQKPPVESPKRSRRKPRPTMLDHDKAYVLMAQAEQEIRDVERQLAQCQQEIVEAQLAALGYIPVMQEDGTIIYINEQQNLIAYED